MKYSCIEQDIICADSYIIKDKSYTTDSKVKSVLLNSVKERHVKICYNMLSLVLNNDLDFVV